MIIPVPEEWQKHKVGEDFFIKYDKIEMKKYEQQLELYNKSVNKDNIPVPKKPIITARTAYKFNEHTMFRLEIIEDKSWEDISEEIDKALKTSDELKIPQLLFKSQSKKNNYEVIELKIFAIGLVEDPDVFDKIMTGIKNGSLQANHYRWYYKYKDKIYGISVVGAPKEQFLAKMIDVAKAITFK